MEHEDPLADVGGGRALGGVARPVAPQQLRVHRVPAHVYRARELRGSRPWLCRIQTAYSAVATKGTMCGELGRPWLRA